LRFEAHLFICDAILISSIKEMPILFIFSFQGIFFSKLTNVKFCF
jgi:hypothetical protein